MVELKWDEDGSQPAAKKTYRAQTIHRALVQQAKPGVRGMRFELAELLPLDKDTFGVRWPLGKLTLFSRVNVDRLMAEAQSGRAWVC